MSSQTDEKQASRSRSRQKKVLKGLLIAANGTSMNDDDEDDDDNPFNHNSTLFKGKDEEKNADDRMNLFFNKKQVA